MSLSFNEAHGVVLWGSEASALNVPFAHGDVESPTGQPGSIQLVGFEDSEAAQPASGEKKHGSVLPKGASSRSHSCTHRYDLDEDGGEVVEVRVASCAATLSMAMAHWAASGNVRDIFSSTIGNMGGLFAPFTMQAGLHLRVYKQRVKKFLSKEEFLHPDSCISISSVLQMAGSSMCDIVAQDLQEIPRVLATIRKEWDMLGHTFLGDKMGKNCLTSLAFYEALKVARAC